jgi:hypothetical protein
MYNECADNIRKNNEDGDETADNEEDIYIDGVVQADIEDENKILI